MEIKTIEITEIKADEGKVLTNGDTYSSVGGSVFLGINDKAENWHEITEEEYNEVIKLQEETAKMQDI
ncbi:MAG: hypothetical protein E7398_05520 [Ruminococcaceae bacterium]|nr:hypothetical protein [Oscillospiraceae bacterium]